MSPGIPNIPTLDHVQLGELRSNCGHDLAIVAEVLELYLREGDQIIPVLRSAVDSANTDSVGALAHKLRGGSSYVGARRMTELCRMLEESSRAGTIDGARDLVDHIECEFNTVTNALLLELKSTTH